MFERFQQDARAVIANARKEATRAGRRAIGTEHLLLGLLTRPGPAADALKAEGADAADLRAHIPQGDEPPPDIAPDSPTLPDATPPDATLPDAPALDVAGLDVAEPEAAESGEAEIDVAEIDAADAVPLTRNARRALDLALRTAHRFRHDHVTSEHMLLALVEQPDSQAVETLKVAGIHVGMLRTDILRQITGEPDAGTTRNIDQPPRQPEPDRGQP
jgi:ATP-dependent Clp protease ATP-binding subunit ClpA